MLSNIWRCVSSTYVVFLWWSWKCVRYLFDMVAYGCFHNILSYWHYANLSGRIELLICLSDILSRVCKIKITFHAIYGAVCIQLTRFSYDDCENTRTWSYHHHQIACMTHLPLSRIRSWNNGMRCMSFCIRIISKSVVWLIVADNQLSNKPRFAIKDSRIQVLWAKVIF